MAKTQTRAGDDQETNPYLEMFAAVPPPNEVFVHSVKIVCGRQTAADCCCVAGARPGVYATQVNIQNVSPRPALVTKLFLPLINAGAVVAREPRRAEQATYAPRTLEKITLPPLGATMDDCCRIAEWLLGGAPSGETPLTIGLLSIWSSADLAVCAVYTANPLGGDGISIDVEYVPAHTVVRGRG